MRQRQEQQKLATISARIDSYETVEGSSEEVEKVRTIYGPSPFSKSAVYCETLCFIPFVFCFLFSPLSDPQGVQLLRPYGSHERNITRGDSTAASRGSAEDERGQRQQGKTESHDELLSLRSTYAWFLTFDLQSPRVSHKTADLQNAMCYCQYWSEFISPNRWMCTVSCSLICCSLPSQLKGWRKSKSSGSLSSFTVSSVRSSKTLVSAHVRSRGYS